MQSVSRAQLIKRIRKIEAQISGSRREPVDFMRDCFPHQRKFIDDPARLKFSFCTRRAAKSYSIGLDLMKTAYEQKGSCLYIGLTRDSAMRTMWRDVFKSIDQKFSAGFKFREHPLMLESPIGSPIYILGLDSNDKEKQKALGQKYRKIYIDEGQSYTIDLHELIYKILLPTTIDYRGTIGVAGTPGNLRRGFYFELTTGKINGWSGHTWSAEDNPYVAENFKREKADLIAANPDIVNTPHFKQEYLGEWVTEDDKFVYRFNVDRNMTASASNNEIKGWSYVLGVDLGYKDATAFAIAAYYEYDKTLYFISTFKKSGMDITDVATQINKYREIYDFDAIVVDGANKQAVEEIKNRHGLPLKTADKSGKTDFIEIMNDDFVLGKIKLLPRAQQLADEYMGLIWDDKSTKRQEHPNCENHLADAALYAWRYCYQYFADEKPVARNAEDETIEYIDAMNALNDYEKEMWS